VSRGSVSVQKQVSTRKTKFLKSHLATKCTIQRDIHEKILTSSRDHFFKNSQKLT